MSWRGLIAIAIFCFSFNYANSQEIQVSPPQKTIAKYDDYEVVGRNSIGTVVHYYSKGSHKLQVFNSKLRPFNEIDLDIEEKRASVEKVLLSKDLILVFYTTIEDNYEHLKVKKINYRLDAFKAGSKLDSIKRGAVNSYEGYFVKPSLNDEYFVAFTFDETTNRMQVHYVLMDKTLKVIKSGDIWTEDKERMTLESVKVNNSGDLMVVIGHLNKRSNDEDDFSFSKFSTHYLAIDAETHVTTELTDETYLFKDLVTNWDEKNRNSILVGTYQKLRENEDVGVFYASVNKEDKIIDYTKVAFEETDFEGSNAPYRKWKDNAEIQIPKRIVSRSDGGFIYLLEAEFHDYQLISAPPATRAYQYYPEYGTYYDENYYYDIKAVSVNPDGEIDWKVNMPKIQETENDRGRYSSYMFCGNNNAVKLLFVDDIYGNGSLTEFNFNPKGDWNKEVLLNSYRDDLMLVTTKGKQVSGNEIIIPSEKKNRLKLVKITY